MMAIYAMRLVGVSGLSFIGLTNIYAISISAYGFFGLAEIIANGMCSSAITAENQ